MGGTDAQGGSGWGQESWGKGRALFCHLLGPCLGLILVTLQAGQAGKAGKAGQAWQAGQAGQAEQAGQAVQAGQAGVHRA